MKCELHVSSEELAELNALLQREIQNTRIELRRTRNPQFRSGLERHVERMEHLAQQLTQTEAPAGAE